VRSWFGEYLDTFAACARGELDRFELTAACQEVRGMLARLQHFTVAEGDPADALVITRAEPAEPCYQ
jgi:hypothetical protein